jgi:predicted RNA polymerase sigma factor
LVAEYTGLNFLQIADLDYIQYLVWLRDAYIHKLSQTEEGREYLDNAWRMEQTKPDREALRKKLRKEETNGA